MSLQIKEEDLSPGPEGPLQPPSPFLIVANKFMGGEWMHSDNCVESDFICQDR